MRGNKTTRDIKQVGVPEAIRYLLPAANETQTDQVRSGEGNRTIARKRSLPEAVTMPGPSSCGIGIAGWRAGEEGTIRHVRGQIGLGLLWLTPWRPPQTSPTSNHRMAATKLWVIHIYEKQQTPPNLYP